MVQLLTELQQFLKKLKVELPYNPGILPLDIYLTELKAGSLRDISTPMFGAGRCAHTQSCPTLCNLMGSSVHGIFQARILERVAISFFRGSSRPRDRTALQADALLSDHQGSPEGGTTDYTILLFL